MCNISVIDMAAKGAVFYFYRWWTFDIESQVHRRSECFLDAVECMKDVRRYLNSNGCPETTRWGVSSHKAKLECDISLIRKLYLWMIGRRITDLASGIHNWEDDVDVFFHQAMHSVSTSDLANTYKRFLELIGIDDDVDIMLLNTISRCCVHYATDDIQSNILSSHNGHLWFKEELLETLFSSVYDE